MKLDIDLNAMFVDKIHDEVEDFKAKDDEFRDEIIRSGQVVGITPQISNAATALNNNINFFLSSCRRNGILTPLNTIIANHLCEYLENMYFEGLADSVDAINVSVENYMKQNGLSRLLHSGTYVREVSEALRYHIQTYNYLCNKIYGYDINQNGERVVSYILTDHGDEKHEIIRAHKTYHQRMNNTRVLEALEKIK